MFKSCPFGGTCIDPGNPSDCEVNSRCVSFNSIEEKIAFDKLPDLIIVRQPGLEIKFKTRNQLKFFLTDYPGNYQVSILINGSEVPVKVNKSHDLELI